MLDLLSGGPIAWLAGLAAVVVALGGAWFKGRSGANVKHKLRDAEHALDLKEKANEAREKSDSDNRTGDERLRDHDRLS